MLFKIYSYHLLHTSCISHARPAEDTVIINRAVTSQGDMQLVAKVIVLSMTPKHSSISMIQQKRVEEA